MYLLRVANSKQVLSGFIALIFLFKGQKNFAHFFYFPKEGGKNLCVTTIKWLCSSVW